MQRVQSLANASVLKAYASRRVHYDYNICLASIQRIGYYMYELTKRGLFLGQRMYKTSKNIQKLQWARNRISNRVRDMKNCDKSECGNCKFDIPSEITDLVDGIREEVGSMCLECVKSGEFKARKGGCKIHMA